ncbi:DUF397 domain-containing protein [Nocardia sp. NEAU-G5]|uniref:DUF397 domain-containing protein n=1 Tax=Nocardia albiluteola TaxID=2842303 RepID=A0ABS6BCG5_9NOCA|nr:DUF397 domain-containing protein [Nocardia albiluteola]MBU3067105.1 DUF397 domain-containing protein [Nocardia albiluteola]
MKQQFATLADGAGSGQLIIEDGVADKCRSSAMKDCVEVTFLEEGLVGVRDSKNPTGPALVFAPNEWDAFTAAVGTGKLGS